MLPKVFPSMSELVVEPQSDDPRGVVAMTIILYASEKRRGKERRREERREGEMEASKTFRRKEISRRAWVSAH